MASVQLQPRSGAPGGKRGACIGPAHQRRRWIQVLFRQAASVRLIISGVAGAHNQIHDGLTHVTDILPTLLDVARARPGTGYQGQPMSPTGHSLLPVSDPAMRVRPQTSRWAMNCPATRRCSGAT